MTTTPSSLSVQLYTVREAAGEDLQSALQHLADIGFTQVEPFAFTSFGDALGTALTASGLSAPTTHQSFLNADAQEQGQIFEAAATLGITTVIDPFHPVEHWQSEEAIAATAAALNAASIIAAERGVKVGYHNHDHEISSRIGERSALEVLADQLDPAVGLEIDAYWVAVGGEDPVEFLRRLGDRVIAVHVKDGPGTKENKDQVAVGSGDQPIREIIAATPDALHVVELDDSHGDRFQAVADSFAFLTRDA